MRCTRNLSTLKLFSPTSCCFTGVAYSITAFPVLCRILMELKLFDMTVGIVVLLAGVGNDIGIFSLNFCNIPTLLMIHQLGGSYLLSVYRWSMQAIAYLLYILFACLGWTLFFMLPVKMVLHWVAQKTGTSMSFDHPF